MSYAIKAMAPGALGGVGGMAYGQMTGMDVAKTMEFAGTVSTVTDFVGGLFIKCFVPETLVWVPYEADGSSLLAETETFAQADAINASLAQIGAGISVAVLPSLSFAALMRSEKSEDEQDEQERRQAGVDSVFGSRSDAWQDLADVLWSEPDGSPHRRDKKYGFS